MTLGAGWLVGMALCIALDRRLPRWTSDGPGLWFSLRLVLEFSIISGLIFKTSLVQPGVLLGQIVVFLPFIAITRVDLLPAGLGWGRPTRQSCRTQ